jgi:hypothetical protein
MDMQMAALIAPEDRPTETPAVQMFQQMQAQRAAQAQAPQVDVNAQYADYLKQTMGTPNQMQAPTAPPPTSTNLAEYWLLLRSYQATVRSRIPRICASRINRLFSKSF